MKTEGKVSRVAICEKCQSYILACHIEYLDKDAKKEFSKLSDDGFTIKTETIEDTKDRPFGDYKSCKSGKCTL